VRRASALALFGLLALTARGPLGAQPRSALDVGLSVVRFPDESTTVSGPSVGWRSAQEWRRLFAAVSASGVGTVGAASGSATFVGGVREPVGRRWLAEGAGELFGLGSSASRTVATGTLSARLIRLAGRGGGWVRGTASLARREGGTLPGTGFEAGAWWGWPRGRLTATVSDERATGQLFAGPLRDRFVGTLPVRYAEGALGAHVEWDATSVDLAAGVRRDPDALRRYDALFVATAAYWQGPSRAWTLTVARQPPDFVRGADAAQWVAVGMRFYQPSPALARAARVRAVAVVTRDGTRRLLRVRATGARRVEVMADFTGWEPVALGRGADAFELGEPVPTGTHHLLVRVDGGAWRPATNTPAVTDDLGGRVGLLVVP
jgi:hypothetical protein